MLTKDELPKNKIAQALVALRHQKLSPERRAAIASLAAKARWEKWRKEKETGNATASY